MSTISPTALLEQLQWRYATKQFDASKKIAPDLWAALEQSLVLTPSSFGLQPWKFLVITDPATKQALTPASWNQSQVADCSHHVVFLAKRNLDAAHIHRFLERQIELRGGTHEALAGYRNIMVGFATKAKDEGWLDEWAIRQVYIALGNFMTSAALLGVDTCPMEGLVPAQYDKILNLETSDYRTIVACSAGYRAAGDKYAAAAKVRFPASEIVQHI
jgi:nitroreductase